MGSVSATHLILFIASLVIAVGIAGTLVMEVGKLDTAIDNRGTSVAEEIETEVAIISDEGTSEAIYDPDASDDDVTILVKNIGSESIPVDERVVDVLIDGTYISNDDIVAMERIDVDGSETWRPGGVVEISIANHDPSGDTELTVIVNGGEDSIQVHL